MKPNLQDLRCADAFRFVAKKLRERNGRDHYICNVLKHYPNRIDVKTTWTCQEIVQKAIYPEHTVQDWLTSYICNHGGFNNEIPSDMNEYRAQWCEAMANQLEGKPFATHYMES